jgi:hypothetical protein
MVRRHRARADIFNPSTREHWLVIENPWRKVIESELLPAGTDLMRFRAGRGCRV